MGLTGKGVEVYNYFMKTMIKENKVFDLEFFRKAGSKGGRSTKKRYGLSHFSKIAPKKKNTLDKGVE